MKRFIFIFIAVFCLVRADFVLAQQPRDQLKSSIDRIIGLLTDPDLQTPEKRTERRKTIFAVVEERFDFAEMSRRSLGEYWEQLSAREQKEFETAFARLLENSYITKIEGYTDQEVKFLGQQPKGNKYYSVNTAITSGGRSIPVNYSLHDVRGQWLVYDVHIEGVSLITNYRSQFRETMRRQKFSGLMAALNDKIKGLDTR